MAQEAEVSLWLPFSNSFIPAAQLDKYIPLATMLRLCSTLKLYAEQTWCDSIWSDLHAEQETCWPTVSSVVILETLSDYNAAREVVQVVSSSIPGEQEIVMLMLVTTAITEGMSRK